MTLNEILNNLKFNRQFIIEHANNQYFIADFYCDKHKLIVEIDGEIHKQQIQYDLIRSEILIELGYTVVRFRNEEILNNWNAVERKLVTVLSPNPSLSKRGEKF